MPEKILSHKEESMREGFAEKILTSAFVSFFFGSTLFALMPANIYFGNVLEFSSPPGVIWPFFASLSLLCTLTLTIALSILKSTVYQRAVALLTALSFLLWLQGYVLVWDYGVLDGTDFDFSSKWLQGLADSAIWISILVFAYKAPVRILKNVRIISGAFILIQILSIIVAMRGAPDASYVHKAPSADIESIYEFSPEKNVLIILLDAFQGSVFEEIITETPVYASVFDGFTFYRNAVSGFFRTDGNVPLILTGRYYDNSIPFKEFVKDAFTANSAPTVLARREGYQIDLVGIKWATYSDEEFPANRLNVKELVGEDVERQEVARILDITLFRCLPHFTKKYIYNNQAWLLSRLLRNRNRTLAGFPPGIIRDAIELMMNLADRANGGNDKYTFKYFHFQLPHGPMRVTEDIKYRRLKPGLESYKEQARATLKLVAKILTRLKRIGVYDNTLLFVVADHGAGAIIEDDEETRNRDPFSMDTKINEYIKGRANPLILLKPFMSSGELKFSDAPVSNADISKTIVSELGLKGVVPGRSIRMVGETESRIRRFMRYDWGRGFWKIYGGGKCLPPMEEYLVTGPPGLDESWHPTYKIYTPEGLRYCPPSTYHYGESIDFGIGGSYMAYEPIGWSYPEEGVVWNNKMKRPRLTIPIEKTGSDIELRVKFQPYILANKVERQRIILNVNDQDICKWVATDPGVQERTATIPNQLLTDGVVRIIFKLPDATRPGMKESNRVLGVGVHSLTLTEKLKTEVNE